MSTLAMSLLFWAGALNEGDGGVASRALVLIVAPGRPGDFERWVAAEVRRVGFESSDVASAHDPETLEPLARERGAVAAIARSVRGSVITVWVADRMTGKLLARVVPGEVKDSERTQAIRAVELLRASVLELALPEPPPSELPIPPAATTLAESAATTPLAADLAIEGLAGFTPQATVALGVGLTMSLAPPGSRFSGVLVARLWAAPAALVFDEGTVSLRPQGFGAGGRFMWIDGPTVKVSVAAGAGIVLLDLEARTTLSDVSPDSQLLVGGSVWLQPAVAVALGERVSLRAAVTGAVQLPLVQISTTSRQVRVGAPWLDLSIGPQLRW